MKKVLLYFLALGLSITLHSQNSKEAPQQHFAVVMGPNLDKALRFGLFDDDLLLRPGYSLGVDYLRELAPAWEAKFSLRYHRLHFAQITYIPVFDTVGTAIFLVAENDKIVSVRNNAWSLSAGVRKFGKPARFRWFWDGEVGATVFVQDPKIPALTFGLGSGWEWKSTQKNWTVFIQPVVRCLLWSSQDPFASHLTYTLELGARHALGARAGL